MFPRVRERLRESPTWRIVGRMTDAAIHASLRRSTEALTELVDWVEEHPYEPNGWIDDLLYRTLQRSTSSVRGIVLLIEAGLPEQAMILGRALFEDAVVAYWVFVNPDPDAVETLAEEHSVAWESRLEEATAGIESPRGWSGSKHWTQRSVIRLLSDVRDWEREGEPNSLGLAESLLSSYLGFFLPNALVHNVPFAMRPWQVRHVAEMNDRLDRDLAMAAVGHASVAYRMLTLIVIDRIAPTCEAMAQLEGIHSRLGVRIGIELSSPVGRNDPCPCGSGLKYKRCCGS